MQNLASSLPSWNESFWGVQSELLRIFFTNYNKFYRFCKFAIFSTKTIWLDIRNSIVTSRDSLKSCDEHITIRLVIFRYYVFILQFFFQGDTRFEIYSLWLLLLLRSYHARITYKLANQSELTETEDDFVFIYCIKQPWVASSIFVAPSAKIGIWIILRKVGCKSGNVQNWLISHCL